MKEEPPVRFRFRGKRAEPEPSQLVEETTATPSTSSKARMGLYSQGQSERLAKEWIEHWTESVSETAWVTTESCFWQDQKAAVELTLEMPESSNGWNPALRDLHGYFSAALKKRTAEVSEKRLSSEDYEKFKAPRA